MLIHFQVFLIYITHNRCGLAENYTHENRAQKRYQNGDRNLVEIGRGHIRAKAHENHRLHGKQIFLKNRSVVIKPLGQIDRNVHIFVKNGAA